MAQLADTTSKTCERLGHEWRDTLLVNDATGVVMRPCKRCREALPVGALCMVQGCKGWPTRRVVKLGGVFMCLKHGELLGGRYLLRPERYRPQ